jgi:putative transposase
MICSPVGRVRILNVVDVTRECLAAILDTSISGKRVARELTTLVTRRGKLGMIVSDHGMEFTSNALLSWAKESRIDWHYIIPGKPMGLNSLLDESSGAGHSSARTPDRSASIDSARWNR